MSIQLPTFTIHGNATTRFGNPTPYTRTLRGKRRPDAIKYQQWQEHVRNTFLTANPDHTGVGRYRMMVYKFGKPLVGNIKARMDLQIEWATEGHGDPDNIFKGIADALFTQDKNLDGSFTSKMADVNPEDGMRRGKVTVTITIEQPV